MLAGVSNCSITPSFIIAIRSASLKALRLADRIAIMKDGVIEQLDTPANIVLNPATEYVRKFTEEVPRGKVLKIADLMEKPETENLSDFKVSKNEIIENVATFSIISFFETLKSLKFSVSGFSIRSAIFRTFPLGTSSVNFLTYSVAGFNTMLAGVSNCSITPSFIIAIRSASLKALRLADRIAIMKDGVIEQLDTPANIVLNPATEYVRKFTEEVPRGKVLKIADLMEKPETENLSDFKVSKNEIIENVAEKILTQEKSVAVTDENNKIVGSVHPSKIIHTVFSREKK